MEPNGRPVQPEREPVKAPAPERALLLKRTDAELLRVTGPDAVALLQGLVTQDALRLAFGKIAPCFFLDANGKVICLVQLWRVARSEFWLLVPLGEGEVLARHMGRYLIMEDARIERVADWRLWSILGTGVAAVNAALGACPPAGLLLGEQNEWGCGGVDLLFPSSLEADLDLRLAAFGREFEEQALEWQRFCAFLPRFGREILAGDNAMLFGYHAAFAHDKGCYIGQETVARTRDRGRPPRLLTLLRTLPANHPLPQPGSALYAANEAANDPESGEEAAPDPQATRARALGEWRSALVAQEAVFAFALIATSALDKSGGCFLDALGHSWSVVQIATYKV